MIKDRLKDVRERTGMNKKEFAEHIGLKYTTYNNYETGAREPDSNFLIMISKKFDVSTDFILGLQEDREILHSYELKASEYNHIEKYRTLDQHGKKIVDMVLEEEHARQLAEQASTNTVRESVPEYLVLNAAHAIEGASPEDIQHDEDIMDDENF